MRGLPFLAYFSDTPDHDSIGGVGDGGMIQLGVWGTVAGCSSLSHLYADHGRARLLKRGVLLYVHAAAVE